MKTKIPLISIIIPVYNRADIISETLDSIIKQTFTDWECIIIDDGSSDNLKEIIEKYKKQDFRFKFEERPKERLKGGNASRNYGFEISKGEFVNWFDSDDIMLPTFLENKIAILNNNEELDFCACYSRVFFQSIDNLLNIEKPKVLKSLNYINDYMLKGLFFDTASPLWRVSFLKKNNLCFDENLLRSQEKDFHLRVLLNKPIFEYLDEVLFLSRKDTNNSITSNFNTNLDLQVSNFKFNHKAFKLINKKDIVSKKIIFEYLFYRQSVNYYNIIQLSNSSLKTLINIKIKYFRYLIYYHYIAGLSKKYFLKIHKGLFFLLFFKKGYKYFYFPEFNHRNYSE